MDIRRLRIFLAVVESGSFTAAAERLSLTQPAVSQQMSLLEHEVRGPLFQRGARGVALTAVGNELAKQARRVVDEMARLEAMMSSMGSQTELKIGAFPSVGIELLPKALQALRSNAPNLRILLRTMSAESAEDALRSGSIDVLIVFDYSYNPRYFDASIRRVHLLDEPFVALVSKSHPLAEAKRIHLKELSNENWIFHRHSPPYQEIYRKICNLADFTPESIFYIDDLHALQGLVAGQIGVSVAPLLSVLPRRAEVAMLEISAPAIFRRVSILSLPDSRRAKEIELLIESLRAATNMVLEGEAALTRIS